MSVDRIEIDDAGAFALYRAEQAHRIAEFEKAPDAANRIRSDFEQFRGKYRRKFQDIAVCLAEQGLRIRADH